VVQCRPLNIPLKILWHKITVYLARTSEKFLSRFLADFELFPPFFSNMYFLFLLYRTTSAHWHFFFQVLTLLTRLNIKWIVSGEWPWLYLIAVLNQINRRKRWGFGHRILSVHTWIQILDYGWEKLGCSKDMGLFRTESVVYSECVLLVKESVASISEKILIYWSTNQYQRKY
jgi:hypothetical protein